MQPERWAALPAEVTTSRSAPKATAAETAIAIPRALNDPVGLRASSLIQRRSSAVISGVQPSTRVTRSLGSIGSIA
jgi:hypothetical protein